MEAERRIVTSYFCHIMMRACNNSFNPINKHGWTIVANEGVTGRNKTFIGIKVPEETLTVSRTVSTDRLSLGCMK